MADSQSRSRNATLPATAATDEQLLARYCEDGDRSRFTELVRRYERELYNYLKRYLGDAQLAEDAFQATFLQVHLKCNQFDERRRFRPWLYTIATNQAIDAQRRNRRHRMLSLDGPAAYFDGEGVGQLVELLVSEAPEPLDEVSRGERQVWVREAIDELSPAMKSVVHLVYFMGMKYREAAEVLEVPVGTVKSRLHSAIQKLEEAWHREHVSL